MTIEIQEPRIEALLQKWMDTGQFRSLEDAVGSALEQAPLPLAENSPKSGRTGADLLAAMKACPYPDFLPEPEKFYMTVRDVEL